MGQNREVEVVRLITRDTIEEQIYALGETKLALDDRIAGAGIDEADDRKADNKAEKQAAKMVEEVMIGKIEEELRGDIGNGSTFANGAKNNMSNM